jgi:hypothetical protein
MKILLRPTLFLIAFSTTIVFCQQASMSKTDSAPEFGVLKCRADAQKWTADPFDKTDSRTLAANTAKMVNGQFRVIPRITPHVTVRGLLERAHEMEVCTAEDSDFDKQYATYSAIAKTYEEEVSNRYQLFLIKHHLDGQFAKEDEEDNK